MMSPSPMARDSLRLNAEFIPSSLSLYISCLCSSYLGYQGRKDERGMIVLKRHFCRCDTPRTEWPRSLW